VQVDRLATEVKEGRLKVTKAAMLLYAELQCASQQARSDLAAFLILQQPEMLDALAVNMAHYFSRGSAQDVFAHGLADSNSKQTL
jgi:hypothetical protein